ncbi:MAG: CAP domain-containing protein [Minisyncoccia bacterium]
MRKRLKNHFIPHEGNDYKPHFVRERNIVGMALLAVAIFGLASSVKTLVTRNPDILSAVITGVLVDLTNSNRLSQNIDPLEFNPILASAAQLKANDMAAKSYFAHTSPEGKTPWYWFTEGGYKFIYAGENLAVNFVDSEDVVQAWMNSQGHRANILNNKFTEIGIAMSPGVYNGRDTLYVVQLFGQPAPEVQAPKPVAIKTNSNPAPILEKEGTSISGAQATAETEPVKVPKVEVLGQDLGEDELFIAVQNTDYLGLEGVESAVAEAGPRSSVVDKALASPKMALELVYIVIGGIVLLALILFVAIEPKRQHPRNIFYVVLLFLLIVTLFYLSSARLFPQILVK